MYLKVSFNLFNPLGLNNETILYLPAWITTLEISL
jgi:hypothetical protein